LTTLLISLITSLILIVLIYRRQNVFLSNKISYRIRSDHLNIHKQLSNEIISEKDLEILVPLPRSEEKKSKNVLSSIEFSNSPFLDLSTGSAIIIPILVLSKASNIEIRDAIRRTWGFDGLYANDTKQFKVFFLVGVDDFMLRRIRTEQILFDDVIQVSLPDLYSFTAYKELSAMMWVRSYFPNAPFYIKTEDEVIMNLNAVIKKLLPTIEPYIETSLVIGWFGTKHSIPRGTYQKYINAVMSPLSVDLYYAMSLLYIVTSQASDRMLDAISHVEDIQHPGDPFVTGILRDIADVPIKNLATSIEDYRYELSHGGCDQAFEKNSKLLFCTSSLHNGSSHSIPEYFQAWDILLSQNQATE